MNIFESDYDLIGAGLGDEYEITEEEVMLNRPMMEKSYKKPKKSVSPKKAGFGSLESRTVVELKQLAKQRGKKGYSKMRKAELIILLRNGNGKKAPNKKVTKKKAPAKRTPVKKTPAKRSSKKTVAKKEMTVVQLRALCKKKGVRGYSKMRKDELIRKCK